MAVYSIKHQIPIRTAAEHFGVSNSMAPAKKINQEGICGKCLIMLWNQCLKNVH